MDGQRVLLPGTLRGGRRNGCPAIFRGFMPEAFDRNQPREYICLRHLWQIFYLNFSVFVDESWEDYLYWQKTNKKLLKRINELLEDISRNPFSGIGKPDPLKHKYRGFWSRKINAEHRLIYRVKDDEIHIAKCRFHYD